MGYNMNMKIWLINIVVVFLLVLTSFPVYESQSIIDIEKKSTNTLNPVKETLDPNMVEMRIYLFRENGVVDRIVKKIGSSDKEELMDRLAQIELSNLNFKRMLEEKFELLIEYGLLSTDISIEDLFDNNKLGLYSKQTDVVSGEDFTANSSVIFFTGVGFGLGTGIGLRLVNRFPHFLLAMAGLGLVLCYDIHKDTLYTLQTFLFPILVGYLSNFIGLIMFAVLPGIFYSNFMSLGVISSTFWFQINVG